MIIKFRALLTFFFVFLVDSAQTSMNYRLRCTATLRQQMATTGSSRRLCYFMPGSRHSRRRDDGIGIKVKTLIGCVNAKRPLNIEEASVKWNHLLLELASLDVLSTRRATDASRPGCRCVTYELHCDPGANYRCPGVCSVLANTIQSNVNKRAYLLQGYD